MQRRPLRRRSRAARASEEDVIVSLRSSRLRRVVLDGTVIRHVRFMDLSSNFLVDLPAATFWAKFTQLAYLDLRNNHIADWQNIVKIAGCPMLTSLQLAGNPVSRHTRYRHFVVNQVTSLEILDTHVIVDDEVVDGLTPSTSARFGRLQEQGRIETPGHIGGVPASVALVDCEAYISHVHRMYQRCSAVVCMQSCMRGHAVRRWLRARKEQGPNAATRIQRSVRGFLLEREIQREVEGILAASESGKALLMSAETQLRHRAATRIQRAARKSQFLGGAFLRARMVVAATAIQHWYRWRTRMRLHLEVDMPSLPCTSSPQRPEAADDALDLDRGSAESEANRLVPFARQAWHALDPEVPSKWEDPSAGFAVPERLPEPQPWERSRPRSAATSLQGEPVDVESYFQRAKLENPATEGRFCVNGRRSKMRPRTSTAYENARLAQISRADSRAAGEVARQRYLRSRTRRREVTSRTARASTPKRNMRKLLTARRRQEQRTFVNQTKDLINRAKEARAEELEEQRRRVAAERDRRKEAARSRAEELVSVKLKYPASSRGNTPDTEMPDIPPRSIKSADRRIRDLKTRRSRSRRRGDARKRSRQMALGFCRATNQVSRSIGAGNMARLRRKREMEAAESLRAVRAEREHRADMRSAALYEHLMQKRAAKARDVQAMQIMLAWRQETDVQRLELVRMRKRYDKQLKTLIRRMRNDDVSQALYPLERSAADGLRHTFDPSPPSEALPNAGPNFYTSKGSAVKQVHMIGARHK